jgi:hypothetical protein
MYATFTSGSDTIKLDLSGSIISVDYYCDYINSGTGLQVQYNTESSVGTYPLVPSPSVGTTNQVQAISVYNKASNTITVTVGYYISTNEWILISIDLAANYTLTYTADGDGWQVYNTNGGRV